MTDLHTHSTNPLPSNRRIQCPHPLLISLTQLVNSGSSKSFAVTQPKPITNAKYVPLKAAEADGPQDKKKQTNLITPTSSTKKNSSTTNKKKGKKRKSQQEEANEEQTDTAAPASSSTRPSSTYLSEYIAYLSAPTLLRSNQSLTRDDESGAPVAFSSESNSFPTWTTLQNEANQTRLEWAQQFMTQTHESTTNHNAARPSNEVQPPSKPISMAAPAEPDSHDSPVLMDLSTEEEHKEAEEVVDMTLNDESTHLTLSLAGGSTVPISSSVVPEESAELKKYRKEQKRQERSREIARLNQKALQTKVSLGPSTKTIQPNNQQQELMSMTRVPLGLLTTGAANNRLLTGNGAAAPSLNKPPLHQTTVLRRSRHTSSTAFVPLPGKTERMKWLEAHPHGLKPIKSVTHLTTIMRKKLSAELASFPVEDVASDLTGPISNENEPEVILFNRERVFALNDQQYYSGDQICAKPAHQKLGVEYYGEATKDGKPLTLAQIDALESYQTHYRYENNWIEDPHAAISNRARTKSELQQSAREILRQQQAISMPPSIALTMTAAAAAAAKRLHVSQGAAFIPAAQGVVSTPVQLSSGGTKNLRYLPPQVKTPHTSNSSQGSSAERASSAGPVVGQSRRSAAMQQSVQQIRSRGNSADGHTASRVSTPYASPQLTPNPVGHLIRQPTMTGPATSVQESPLVLAQKRTLADEDYFKEAIQAAVEKRLGNRHPKLMLALKWVQHGMDGHKLTMESGQPNQTPLNRKQLKFLLTQHLESTIQAIFAKFDITPSTVLEDRSSKLRVDVAGLASKVVMPISSNMDSPMTASVVARVTPKSFVRTLAAATASHNIFSPPTQLNQVKGALNQLTTAANAGAVTPQVSVRDGLQTPQPTRTMTHLHHQLPERTDTIWTTEVPMAAAAASNELDQPQMTRGESLQTHMEVDESTAAPTQPLDSQPSLIQTQSTPTLKSNEPLPSSQPTLGPSQPTAIEETQLMELDDNDPTPIPSVTPDSDKENRVNEPNVVNCSSPTKKRRVLACPDSGSSQLSVDSVTYDDVTELKRKTARGKSSPSKTTKATTSTKPLPLQPSSKANINKTTPNRTVKELTPQQLKKLGLDIDMTSAHLNISPEAPRSTRARQSISPPQ